MSLGTQHRTKGSNPKVTLKASNNLGIFFPLSFFFNFIFIVIFFITI